MSHVTSGQAQAPTANPKHEQARQQIEKLLERDKDKDAYSQAKALYRLDASQPTRNLLERAYLLRIKGLVRSEQLAAAKEVALGLLNLGVQESSIVEPLTGLLTKVGLGDRALELGRRLASPESQARLTLDLADRLVLKPELSNPLSGEWKESAAKIRAALAGILAGDAAALGLLDGIPRQSPLADWKLLARGLAASYRGDAEQARANWDRLQAGRAPHQIAQVLVRGLPGAANAAPGRGAPPAAKGGSPSSGGAASFRWDLLESQLYGTSVLVHLDALQKALHDDPAKQILQALKNAYSSLRHVGPDLAVRLTAIVLEPIVERALKLEPTEGQHLLREFTKVAQPLPLDPHWNRLWALVWTKAGDGHDHALPYWKAYLGDIAGLSHESAERRQLMTALVWSEIGDICADLAVRERSECDDGECSFDESSAISDAFDDQAEAAYEQSLAANPGAKSVYMKLADLVADQAQGERDDDLLRVLRRMLAAFPNDYEVAERVFHDAMYTEDAALALEAALRGRQLKVLDPQTVLHEFMARGNLAWRLAMAKRWDEARRELAAARELCATPSQRVESAAQQVALEFRAHQSEAAEALIGQTAAADQMLFWLVLALESSRYRLSSSLRARFAGELHAALKRKKVAAAAAMAEYLVNRRHLSESCDAYEQLENSVVEHVSKCSRVKFTERELENVIELLVFKLDYHPSVARLAKRGIKSFPESAFFHFYLAFADFLKQQNAYFPQFSTCRRSAETAAKLAARPGDPHADLLPLIRQFTATLDCAPMPFAFPDLFRFRPAASGDEDDDPGEDAPPQRGGYFGRARKFFSCFFSL